MPTPRRARRRAARPVGVGGAGPNGAKSRADQVRAPAHEVRTPPPGGELLAVEVLRGGWVPVTC